jgi:Reverse transcriptase (RNA-dependent DNA polymerase)
LVQAKLPPSFWPLAVAAYIHTSNRTPKSALDGKTPYHYWTGKKPDISYFRVFGCLAYVLIHKDKRKALQPHSKKCIFVGYPDGVKAWKFWDPVEKKIIISSHAVFDERCFPGNSTTAINLASIPDVEQAPFKHPEVVLHQGGDEDNDDEAPAPADNNDCLPPVPEPAPPPAVPVPVPGPAPVAPQPPRRTNPPRSGRHQGSLNESVLERRSTAQPVPISINQRSPSPVASTPDPLQMPPPAPAITPPPSPSLSANDSGSEDELNLLLNPQSDDELEYADVVQAGMGFLFEEKEFAYLSWDQALDFAFSTSEQAFKTSCHDGEPNSYAEAMTRPEEERKLWHKAALDELQALIENGTFDLVQLPPGRKAIGSRWVFKVKKNADGSIERLKGRLVAQGFSQRPGFDFTETFAPTPKWAALRAILALAALEDLHLESVDISSAFLNGKLEEEVYMRQPEGFVEKGKDWVWRLQKSLYGLKQAGRCWHKKLNEVLESMGFKRIVCEHSIWIFGKDEMRIIIPVFIDDMTIAAKSMDSIKQVISELKSHFKLRELGPTSWLLGVEIIRDRSKRTLSLSQHQYVLSLLERFGMSDCNPVVTPMDPGLKLSSTMSPTSSKDIEEMHSVPYLQAVGALMYLATATRPDIAYTVGVLARFNKNPGMTHWKAVKHLFRYLKGTLDLKLTYAPDPTSIDLFISYTDADHGGNPDNGRSTSGYVVKMGTGAISWSSKLQSIVALSTTEAEYVASTSAGQEILWLRNLFSELGYSLSSPSPLWIDSNSALSVAKNPEHHGRMKHLDLRFYWLRDEVEKGTIHIAHLRTDEMPADVLTKPLVRVKHERFVEMLGLKK